MYINVSYRSSTEAPSTLEAIDLVCVAATAALAAVSTVASSVFPAFRWIELLVLTVVIRTLACRFCSLADIRLHHLSVVDDERSPLQATFRIHIPKSKADILGTKGGAFMRVYPYLHNRYLCPVYALSLWLLLVRPFLEKAVNERFITLVSVVCVALAQGRSIQLLHATQRATLPAATSDEDVMKATLRSVYVFPRITKKGEPSFLVPLKSSAASERLAELRTRANYGDRPFTFHGIVSEWVRRLCSCRVLARTVTGSPCAILQCNCGWNVDV